jgi:regulator of replication initiation timing
MTIRKKVLDDIRSRLLKELQSIDWKIRGNKSSMNKLVEEQTVLKRERVELHKILNSFYKEKPDDDKIL